MCIRDRHTGNKRNTNTCARYGMIRVLAARPLEVKRRATDVRAAEARPRLRSIDATPRAPLYEQASA
eukprot:3428670-Alexandrium_andersonii.AAC.1